MTLSHDDNWPTCPDCNSNSLFEITFCAGIVQCLACGARFKEEGVKLWDEVPE